MTTPSDLVITPRDRRFGRTIDQKKWWLGGDPIATAFFNALSITFPKGEAFFIDSVRKYRDGASPKLEAEINAFIKQEVIHSREHIAFNKRVSAAGYDVTELEIEVQKSLDMTKGRPEILNLAVTMALEHYTAILAKFILNDKSQFAATEHELADMWRWHAIEEIEHKGVAYDTWRHATKDWTRFRRWKVKTIMMLLVTRDFWRKRIRGAEDLLRQDGITGWKARGGILKYLLLSPGMLTRMIPEWLSYFMPGFHPWNEDDRHYVQSYDSAYEAARMDAPVAGNAGKAGATPSATPATV
ncbi:metal-dependent hydrolase [Pseudonocardia sp. TMWB2A]|uniref:metal-dependent hydrolase n=1 Tax=Pseudonocardia sp. TMWB2A TaxID=687430 RepID=UPI00307F474B